MQYLRNSIIALSIATLGFAAQAQKVTLVFSPSKTNMTQLEFVSKSVAFSGIEFIGCMFRDAGSSRYRQLLSYDGIDFGNTLEIYSSNLSDRTIKTKDIDEKNAVFQEYIFRHAVCTMQLQLR